MRILVTGGAGFIGSHLVERFLERGDDVFVVDDLSTGSLDNLAAVRHHPKLHLNVDTILNHPMMDETVGKCDMVIHLAAAVGVRKIIEKPVETITTNVRGTEIILDCCHRHEVPLFLASTSEIYGKAGVQLHEEIDRVMGSSTHRRWAYACTKVLDEFLALAYHHEHGLPVIVARFFNSTGPSRSGLNNAGYFECGGISGSLSVPPSYLNAPASLQIKRENERRSGNRIEAAPSNAAVLPRAQPAANS